MEMQDNHEKNLLAMQDQQLKAQRDQLETQLLVQKQQFEEYVKQNELALAEQEVQIKAQQLTVQMAKVDAGSNSDEYKHAINQENNRMTQVLELRKLELERMRIRLSEAEKLLEERRLASEQQLKRMRVGMEAIEKRMQTPIVPKRKRKGTIISDDLGNPVAIEIEEQD